MVRKKPDIEYGVSIPLTRLMVDFDYQRPPREQWALKESKRLDKRLLGSLEVSARGDGKYYVMDGQGRVSILGFAGETSAICNVHHGLTPSEEAGFFRRYNRERSAVKPYHDFRAALFQGDREAVEINKTVSSFNLSIEPGGASTKSVKAIGALKAIYRRGGTELLHRVLYITTKAWDDVYHRRTDGELLLGMASFLSVYGDRVSDTLLIRKFGKTAPNSILADADVRKYTSRIGKRQAVAETLVDIFDSGKRTRRLRPSIWEDNINEEEAA